MISACNHKSHNNWHHHNLQVPHFDFGGEIHSEREKLIAKFLICYSIIILGEVNMFAFEYHDPKTARLFQFTPVNKWNLTSIKVQELVAHNLITCLNNWLQQFMLWLPWERPDSVSGSIFSDIISHICCCIFQPKDKNIQRCCVYMSIVVWIFSSHISWQHARLQTRLGLRFQNPDTILLSLKLKNLFNQPFDSTLIILCKEMKSFH